MRERRQHPRFPVRLLVQHQVLSEEHPEVDYATDMSRGGLFVASKRDVVAKAGVHLQLAPAKDAQLVSVFGRVSHVTPRGFGIEFVGLDRDAAALIASALPATAPVPGFALEGGAPAAVSVRA